MRGVPPTPVACFFNSCGLFVQPHRGMVYRTSLLFSLGASCHIYVTSQTFQSRSPILAQLRGVLMVIRDNHDTG